MTKPLRSRREENRAATHRAIVDAAYDLVREVGAEGLTVEAVSDRAGVSRRTFFNYFGSLEATLAQPVIEMLAVAVGEFTRRPEGEDPLDSVRACLAVALTPERLPRLVEQFRVCSENASALRHHLYEWHVATDKVLDVLAARVPGEDPVYATTVAAAALGVLERTVTTWIEEGDTASLDGLLARVDRAFTYLATGLGAQADLSQN